LMMLVEHDVEAELVAKLPLVVIAMEQVGGDARIAFAVREGDAQRTGMLIPGRVIGLFAEVIDPHGVRSLVGGGQLVFMVASTNSPARTLAARLAWAFSPAAASAATSSASGCCQALSRG